MLYLVYRGQKFLLTVDICILSPPLCIGTTDFPGQLTSFVIEDIPDSRGSSFGQFELKISWEKPEGTCTCIYCGIDRSNMVYIHVIQVCTYPVVVIEAIHTWQNHCMYAASQHVSLSKFISTTGADLIHDYSIHLTSPSDQPRCANIDYTRTAAAVRENLLLDIMHTGWGEPKQMICSHYIFR